LTNAGHCSLRLYALGRFKTTLHQQDRQCMYIITLWHICVTSPCHGKATVRSVCIADPHVAVISRKESSVNVEMEQLVSFSLLSSYKVFHTAVNNVKVLRSSCNMPNIFVQFHPNLEFLDRFSCEPPLSNTMNICQVGAMIIHTDGHDKASRHFLWLHKHAWKSVHHHTLQWKYGHQIVLYRRFAYAWN
jgi:hypothetical protein